VFGRLGPVDYAAEAKNAALSSRPHQWDPRVRGWENPTASVRLGWHPRAAWMLGASFSSGPYLTEDAASTLAPGQAVGDFRQSLVAADAAYAWRHLEVWAEFFASRFAIPIHDPATSIVADTTAYYLEMRYRLTPTLFGALRWNQQFFGDVPDGHGGKTPWDHDVWRADAAVGWRFARRLQAKLQYAFSQQTGHLQQGQQLVAGQLTFKF
jgi:hypothetical protein